MRALLVTILVAAVLWSGYWFVGARALERGVEDWLAQQAVPGIATTPEGVVVRGFPNRFDVTVTEPHFADTYSGLSWTAPFVQVFAMTWKPWHVITALPDRQTVTLGGQQVDITSSRLRGSLVVTPGTELTLDRITVEGDNLRAVSSRGWQSAVSRVLLATRRDAADAASHDIWLEATSITPDQRFRMALQPLSDLPELVDRLRIDLKVGFSAPIDRFAVTRQPGLMRIEVRDAGINWGPLDLTAKGSIQSDAQGWAQGRIDIRVKPWRDLVPVLVAAGLVTPEVAPTIERAMELQAQQGADPDALDMPLRLEDGRMSLGPIPLGPAPRMVE